MKVECSVCGREGILEQRGNSSRVVHYQWEGGKRVFTKHTVKRTDGNMGTMGTALGTEKPNSTFFNEYKHVRSGRRLAGLGHKPSKLAIPGSNPGDRTRNYCFHSCPLN